MSGSARQLDYGPPLKLRQKRWWRRALVAIVVIASIVYAARRVRPDVQRRLDFVHLQRACLTHEWPGGTVVFEQTAQENAAREPAFRESAKFTPDAWQKLLARHLAGVGGAAGGGPSPHGTVFLHGRSDGRGNTRLVAIDLHSSWQPDATSLSVLIRLLEPGTFRDPRPRERAVTNVDDGHGQAVLDLLEIPFGHSFLLLGGRANPDDATHFTIDFEADGTPGTIDGWLLPGDVIKLKFRRPPPPPFVARLPAR